MNKKVMLALCAFSVFQSPAFLKAAELDNYLPIANVPETWATNDSGWKLSPLSDATKSYSASSKALAIKFFQKGVPLGDQRGAVSADGTASLGLFVGNFTNSAIDKICFDVMKTGVLGGRTKVTLTGSAGLVEYDFEVPAETGVWAKVEVPLAYGAGWIGAGSADEFKTILSDVTSVDIVVYSRAETAAAMLYIDNFRLLGPWEKGPMIGDASTPVPVYWLMTYGLEVAAGQGTNDWDRDGFNNYSEYMAGTDPLDANSFFRIEISPDETGRPVVKWRHVDYRTFTVMATEDLTSPNGFQVLQSRISSQAAGNKWVTEESASPFKAYKVQIEAQ